jgi:transcriptional regulator with XRE-family HTH domain
LVEPGYAAGMDARTEIREFLTSRRAKITPDQVGLPVYGENRRVPGLRREEVALLAGVSVDYYTRLERGNAGGVSDSVLDALARALRLDEAERSHLFDLARATQPTAARRRRPTKQQVRPAVQRILDAMTHAPAFIRNGRLDLLAANQLGYALYSTYLTPGRPANTARFVFLDPGSEDFYDDWDHVANELVAILRSEAGRNPYDRDLTNLIGELSTQSEIFRTKWAAHNVRFHDTGTKRLHHPIVGDVELTYEAMELSADSGLIMFAYTAEPGTKSEQALDLLGSWVATPVEPDIRTTDQA